MESDLYLNVLKPEYTNELKLMFICKPTLSFLEEMKESVTSKLHTSESGNKIVQVKGRDVEIHPHKIASIDIDIIDDGLTCIIRSYMSWTPNANEWKFYLFWVSFLDLNWD